MVSGQWLVGSFEISLQRYYIFRQVVGNVLPIITGGCNFSPDRSGRTRAGAVVLNFAAKVLHFLAGCWASTPNNYGERMIFLTRSSDSPYSAAILA